MSAPRRPRWTRRTGFLTALVVVVVTNAAVFAHVAWNRSGGPTATLVLTDREIHLPGPRRSVVDRSDEDTGLSLTLNVQGLYDDWLDRRKLRALGFDVSVDPDADEARRRYQGVLPRDAWIVLELDGEAWRRWLTDKRAEIDRVHRRITTGEASQNDLRIARNDLTEGRVEASRLFAVDAGLDRQALRERYDDPSRYAVVPGAVRLHHLEHPPDRPARLEGAIELLSPRLQVPLRFREPTVGAMDRRSELGLARAESRRGVQGVPRPWPIPPVYRAEVAFGRLGEPWLEAVTEIPASDSHSPPAVTDETSGESTESE